jgi:hypothetical protein
VGAISGFGVSDGVTDGGRGDDVAVDVGVRVAVLISLGAIVDVEATGIRAACLCTNMHAFITNSVKTTNKYDFFIYSIEHPGRH